MGIKFATPDGDDCVVYASYANVSISRMLAVATKRIRLTLNRTNLELVGTTDQFQYILTRRDFVLYGANLTHLGAKGTYLSYVNIQVLSTICLHANSWSTPFAESRPELDRI